MGAYDHPMPSILGPERKNSENPKGNKLKGRSIVFAQVDEKVGGEKVSGGEEKEKSKVSTTLLEEGKRGRHSYYNLRNRDRDSLNSPSPSRGKLSATRLSS